MGIQDMRRVRFSVALNQGAGTGFERSSGRTMSEKEKGQAQAPALPS
jgi:hypothetical protein